MPKERKQPDWNAKIAKSIGKAAGRSNRHAIECVKPEKAALMLQDIVEGMRTTEWQAKWHKSGTDYLRFIRKHVAVVEERKEWMARGAVSVAAAAQELTMDKLEQLKADPDELRKVNVRDLAMVQNLAVNNFNSLTEGSRITVEHRVGVGIEDAAKLIQEARDRIKAKQQAVEVVVEPIKEGA